MPIGIAPTTVLALVNAGKKYRPSHHSVATSSDPFADLGAVQELLLSWNIPGQVRETDLEQLQELQKALQSFIAWDEKHDQPFRNALETINQFAAQCRWTRQLSETGVLVEKPSGSIAAMVASLCVTELSHCALTRLKTCCRPSCELTFYDTTRNRSAKWHAENPCGWRARAARNRLNETEIQRER